MVAAHCSDHGRRLTYFGSTSGRAIQKQEIAPYVKLARQAIKKLGASQAVVAALDTMRTLLNPGEEPAMPRPLRMNERWLLWRELLRLHNVTPHEALAATAGVWMYAIRNPRDLPDDARLTYALGRAVLKLRAFEVVGSHWNDALQREETKYRVLPGLASGLLGRRIRKSLGVFYLSLARFIDQQHEAALQRAAALRTPLTA